MLARMLEMLDADEHVEQHRLFVRATAEVLGDGIADRPFVLDEQADRPIDAIDPHFCARRAVRQERRALPREYLLQLGNRRCFHQAFVVLVSHHCTGGLGATSSKSERNVSSIPNRAPTTWGLPATLIFPSSMACFSDSRCASTASSVARANVSAASA